jgi:GPH family glycoside/pentoside/hexuronide:cation symporter
MASENDTSSPANLQDAPPSEPQQPDGGGAAKTDEEPSLKEIICYGTAGVTNSMNNQSLARLFKPIVNLGLGIDPALIGFMFAAKSLWDAFTDPAMAQISDNWKSKHGRRRPFILWGGIAGAIIECLMWWLINPDWKADNPWFSNTYFWYFAVFLIFIASAQTVFSVPYWALGIELAPSYHGKTRVMAVQSVFMKIAMIFMPWLYALCVGPLFENELQGVRILSLILSVVLISGVLVTYFSTRERVRVDRFKKDKPNIFESLAATFTNRHFVKVTCIFIFLSFTLGTFGTIGMYLNIFYVYGGDKYAGAVLGGWVGMEGTLIALLGVPFMTWFCRKFQKHNALRFALGALMIGKVLEWWLINPRYPWLQVFSPFFFSFGISAFFFVLNTMFADVVDVDELITGRRREGMFGACSSWIQKSAGAIVVAMSGIIINATGFDVDLGRAQTPETILNMRICYCLLPAGLLGIGYLLLRKYPLTEEVISVVKAELEIRREKVHREAEAEELAAMKAEEESAAQETASEKAEEDFLEKSPGN